MRTLKKSLALVLVVALAVSLLSVGAFASTSGYSDTAKVGSTYAEAVDVLTGIGVVSGTTTTTLDPTGNYTREQAAKVICYLALGKASADALVTSRAPFSDVAADRWSAGYIAYCVNQKIIAGNGDGTFNPTGALTGYAWAKMLVTALGYNQAGELTGSGWEIATAKLALGLKVFNNDTSAATNKTITRQQAMLLAFNTMFITEVTATMARDNGTVYVSAYAPTTGSPTFASTTYGYTTANTAPGKAANNTLVKVATTVNGATGYNWYYNNTTTPVTGFYTSETGINTNTSGKSLSTQTTYGTSNSYFTAKVTTATAYYSNGASLGIGDASSAAFTSAAAKVGNGTVVKYVDTDNDTTTAEKVYITNYTVGVLKAAPVTYTGASDGKTYVYINMSTGTAIGVPAGTSSGLVLASNVTGYAGLAANDVVTVAAMADGTYVINKAATFTGSATASTASSITIGGTVYKTAMNASAATFTQGYLNSVAFYTDANGFIIHASAVTSAVTNYLFILANGTYSSTAVTAATNQSYVAFGDGTTATITVSSRDSYTFASDSATMGLPVIGNVYAYTKNTDGTYALSSVSNATSARTLFPTVAFNSSPNTGYTTATATPADSNGAITTGMSLATGTTNFSGNANTKYIVRNIKTPTASTVDNGTTTSATNYAFGTSSTGTTYNSTWTVYTGYVNAPTVTKAYYAAVNGSDGYASVVFVSNYISSAPPASSVFYLLDTTPTAVYKATSLIDYYTFPAIVDGVKTVVKSTSLDPTAFDSSLNTDGLGNLQALTAGVLCQTYYDANGYIVPGKTTPLNYISVLSDAALGSSSLMKGSFIAGYGIWAPANGVVSIGTATSMTGSYVPTYTKQGYAYSASTYVFYISADKSTVTMGTVDALSDNATATIYAVTNAAAVVKAGGSPTPAQQNSLYAIFVQLS